MLNVRDYVRHREYVTVTCSQQQRHQEHKLPQIPAVTSKDAKDKLGTNCLQGNLLGHKIQRYVFINTKTSGTFYLKIIIQNMIVYNLL